MPPVPGVTKRMELDRLTPVFSTALRPTGLSGFIRRIAYDIPESHARHWATLMLADRVDVMEHRLKKVLKAMVLVPAGTAVAVLLVAKVARQFRH
jgi:ParB-like chromosome segregation protein Spo0J